MDSVQQSAVNEQESGDAVAQVLGDSVTHADEATPLRVIVRRIETAFSAGDFATAASLVERNVLAAWFGLSTERFGEMVATFQREGVGDSAVLPVMLQVMTPTDELEPPSETSESDPLTAVARSFQLRMQGRHVEAMEAAARGAEVRRVLQPLFDAHAGWGLFEALQYGVTAMLAGDFTAALSALTRAQMHVVVPTLVFLSRDAYVKMAMLHALYGDAERARALLRDAERFSRTEVWAEEHIDVGVAIAASQLPGVSPEKSIQMLDAVQMQAIGEMWPFYFAALHRSLLAAGLLHEAEQRAEAFSAFGLPHVDGQGFAGSIFPLTAVTRALSRGDLSAARREIAKADGSLALTRIIAGLLETLAGRPAEALEAVSGIHDQTGGLRQLELWRYSIAASSHLTLGGREDCYDVLKFALETSGSLTPVELSYFSDEVCAFAKEEVADWPVSDDKQPSYFDIFPAPGSALTPREIEVLGELSRGLSREQIASAQYISVNTLKGHLRSIYRKLGVNSRARAVLEAERRGLI